MGDRRYGEGDPVRVVSGHEDRAGRRGRVTQVYGPYEDYDYAVELAGGEVNALFEQDLEPDAAPLALEVLDEVLGALDRAATLVRVVTVGQAFDAGEAAIAASGLDPWALNEGKAVRGDRLDAWWLDFARARAEAVRDALRAELALPGGREEG